MKKFLCLFLFSLFSSSIIFGQEASNVKVEATSEELIILYDLIGKSSTTYDVELFIIEHDGNRFSPETVFGDIGRVLTGGNKRIIWKVYSDVETLSGEIKPDIKVSLIEDTSDEILPTPEPPRVVEDVFVEQIPGQKSKNQKIKAGTKFAIGNSSLSTESQITKEMFSWEGGFFFRWNALRKIYLQPELLYHRQAYKTLSAETVHHFTRAQGIIGYSPFGGGLYIHGGPYYQYRINTKETILEGDKEVSVITEYQEMNGERSPFKDSDYGYVLGGNLNFGKGSFALGLQYSNSLVSPHNSAYYYPTILEIESQSYRSLLFYFQKSF